MDEKAQLPDQPYGTRKVTHMSSVPVPSEDWLQSSHTNMELTDTYRTFYQMEDTCIYNAHRTISRINHMIC